MLYLQEIQKHFRIQAIVTCSERLSSFYTWATDYIPILLVIHEGYVHICRFIDAYSKWVELLPIRTKTSKKMADSLYWQIMIDLVFHWNFTLVYILSFLGK